MISGCSETPLDRLRSALSAKNKSDKSALQGRLSKQIRAPFHAQIKILEILPVDPREPEVIRCTLRNREPSDKRPYTALSYVWGDPKLTTSIFLNGRQVSVTTNLAEALYHLRDRPECAESLWIDALCIDQQNEREKSQQVQMMDAIFREADTVVAWLGPGDDTSKRAMETLSELSNIARDLGIRDVHQPDEGHMKQEECKELVTESKTAILESAAFQKGDWGFIVDLLRKPYWSRLWILQEISLAKNAILTCGPENISWEKSQAAFALMCWVYWRALDAEIDFDETSTRFHELLSPYHARDWDVPPAVWLSARVFAAGGSALEFGRLFKYTCDATRLEASEPSDCIYALLGLMTPTLREAITVDYERDPVVLFTAITLYSLECYGTDVLIYCGLAYRSASQTDLPSWALDRTSAQLRGEGITRGMRNYKHSVPCQVKPKGPSKVVIRGASVSRIVTVVEYSGRTEDAVNVLDELERISQTSCIFIPSLRALILSVLVYRAGIRDTISLDENKLWNTCRRSLFITEHGHVGSGPAVTQVGDVVHAFEGCTLTFLLRPSPGSEKLEQWQLVGPSYVEGITSLGGEEEMQAFWDSGPEIKEIIIH